MRGTMAISIGMLLICCSPPSVPSCPIDAGTDAAPRPDVDPDCLGLTPQDLAGWPGEIETLYPRHLSIDGRVAHADFLGLGAASDCVSLVRFRIGLDDGVVTLTDHACVEPRWTQPALCRVDLDADLEVHALARGHLASTGSLAGSLIRVVRHSTGETLFTFGQGVVPYTVGAFDTGTFKRDRVFLAPERASDPRCCPTDACVVMPCGYDEPYAGCRWTDEVSTADGFCHARLVD